MASDDREWLVYHIAQADDLPREMIRAMPDDHLRETATEVLIVAPARALSAATARLAEVEAERDCDERIAAEALRALAIAVRRAEGVEAMRDLLRADLRADRLALARLQEAGGTLAHLLQHCRTTVAAERRAGIARWAEALAGGPDPAQGEAAFAGTWLVDPDAPAPAVPWSEVGDQPPDPQTPEEVALTDAGLRDAGGGPDEPAPLRVYAIMPASPEMPRPTCILPVAPGDEVDIPF